jgi:predicted Zn-dependent protease
MRIKELLLFFLSVLCISCATVNHREDPQRDAEDADARLFTALTYFNFSEYERQEAEIDNAYQLLQMAYDTCPESIFLKEKLLMYLSASALRDSMAAEYVLKLGEEWYAAGTYNSRIMFILGEVSLQRNDVTKAEKYFRESLADETDKNFYLTYYMFKKLYNPPADTLYLEQAVQKPWNEEDKDLVYRVADIYQELGNIERTSELLYNAYQRWGELNILLNLVALNQYQGQMDAKVEAILQDLLANDELPEQLVEYLISEYYNNKHFDKVVALEKECRRLGNEYSLKILYISAIEIKDYDLAIEIGNLILLLEGILPDQKYIILGKLWEIEFTRNNWQDASSYLKATGNLQKQYALIKMIIEELDAEDSALSFLEYYYQNTDDKNDALFLLFLFNRNAGKMERLPELLSLLDPGYVIEQESAILLALPFLGEETELGAADKALYQPFLERNALLAGLFYYYAGETDLALTYMREAYNNGTSNLEMLLIYGNILQKTSAEEELLPVLKIGITKYPESAEMLNFYGYMAAELKWENEYPAADSALQKALALEPENGMFWDSLGWLYYRMGRNEEALAAMQKSEAEARKNGDIALHYGIILALHGNKEKAQEFLQLVAELTEDEILRAEAKKQLTALDN